MTPRRLAEKYMDFVFKTGDLEALRDILSDNLSFSGPFYRFDSADDYVDSLRNDPPEDFEYEIIRGYEDSDSACLIYQFSKPGISTLMTQIFWTNDEKISRILLIFDTGAFRLD